MGFTRDENKKLYSEYLSEINNITNSKIALNIANKIKPYFIDGSRLALYWLIKACNFSKNETDSHIDFEQFFSDFNFNRHNYVFLLFSSNFYLQDELFNCLRTNKNFKSIKIEINTYYDTMIFDNLKKFLILPNNVIELDVGSGLCRKYLLTAETIKPIADILTINTSIKSLIVVNNLIGDSGAEYIYDCIASNPNSSIKFIDMFCCNVKNYDIFQSFKNLNIKINDRYNPCTKMRKT